MMKTKEDSTRNGRQARRREREKAWLKEHGWGSWEALHTALMRGEVEVMRASHQGQKIESEQIPGDM